jgi:hypothetical protein
MSDKLKDRMSVQELRDVLSRLELDHQRRS